MATWKAVTLFTGANTAKARSAQDDYQHAWVDGSDGSPAHRVIINAEGEIVVSQIGITKPLKRATLSNILFNDENDKGTGIGRGKILLLCYTYVNDDNIESNPSPILVYDKAQYMAKGYYTKDGITYYYPVAGGTYVAGNNIVGSIESFTLSIPIDSADVKQVRVYLAVADYSESYIPVTPYQLISTSTVPTGSTTHSVIISSVPSIVEASYDKDIAPRGDDIALADGVPFIANSVNPLGYPSLPVQIWAITINNGNNSNYVNRFHRIDLYDEEGERGIGESYLEGLSWDTVDISKLRIMDSDLTTPLEVYHYPKDAQLKLHRLESVSGTGVKASLVLGTAGSTDAVTITARVAGTAGNSITAETIHNITIGTPVIREGEDIFWLYLESALGAYHITLDIVKPAAYNPTLSIALVTTDTYKHAITVTLETANTGGYPSVTTADELYDLIDGELGLGGDLYGIIDSIDKQGEWDDAYVIPDTIDTENFIGLETVSSTSSSDITVRLKYSTYLSSVISTALEVVAAINADVDAMALVEPSINTEPGGGYTPITAQTNLSGGTGSPAVAATDELFTRFLAWVRIPHLPANTNSTVYLVLYETIPTGLEGEFVELIASGTPTDTQMLLTDFYKDVVTENPIRDEGVAVLARENVPTEISRNGNSLWDALGYENAANKFLGSTPLVQSAYLDVWYRDEYADSESEDIGYSAATYLRSNSAVGTDPWVKHILSTPLSFDNTIWGSTKMREIVNDGTQYIALIELSGGKLIYLIRERHVFSPGYDRIIVKIVDGATTTYLRPTATNLLGNVSEWAGHTLYFAMSITQTATEQSKLSLAININGYFGYAKDLAIESIDMVQNATVYIYTYSSTIAKYGFARGLRLSDSYDVINLMRYMPLYPLSQIGAHKTFIANTETVPKLCYSNVNVAMDTVAIERDNKPGRIQWGSYAGMPDQNEYAINESIIRIVPMKSLMPTDEHNTILVFTKTNVYRLALLGNSADDCRVIKELSGLGLVNADCLIEINAGYAWLSPKGIITLSERGLRNISDGIIDTSSVTSLSYDAENNWIWARTSTGCYVFQLDDNFRWLYTGERLPSNFLSINGGYKGWIDYANNIIYKHGSTASAGAYKTRILTKAVRVIKKLGRFKLISNFVSVAYTYYVKLHGARVGTGTATSSAYNAYTNVKTAVPGASADYVQLDLQGINNAVAVEIENLDGRG